MNALDVIEVTRDSIWVLIKISTPLMLVAMSVGLAISFVQALTQIQEMTLTFVPKILAMLFALMLLMPMILEEMTDFHQRLNERMMNLD